MVGICYVGFVVFGLEHLCPHLSQAKSTYIDIVGRANGHPQQAQTHQLAGMGILSAQLHPIKLRVTPAASVTITQRSATHYSMELRDGRYYHGRYQIGFDSK
jgi:hypothetical protein